MAQYIDRSKVRSMTADRLLKNKSTNSNTELCSELNTYFKVVKPHLEASTTEKTANWLLQHDLWLQNENRLLTSSFYNYGRGDIVFSVDMGTSNMGTEIRYPHPCVVIHDNREDWLIVAPITGAQFDRFGNPIIHQPYDVFVQVTPTNQILKGEFTFSKPSVIQLDQIQRISKHRIINRKSLKLRTDLLNQVDNFINQYYAPSKYRLIDDLKKKLQESENKNKVLSSDLVSKEHEIHKLNKELDDYRIKSDMNNNQKAVNF